MSRKIHFLLVSLLAISLLDACSSGDRGNQARTYYESLELETPEEAVETFVEAFQREDWPGLFLILAPDTQYYSRRLAAETFSYGHLVDEDHAEAIVSEVAASMDEGEHGFSDFGYSFFDPMMIEAKRQNALLVDLSGEVRLVGTNPGRTSDGIEAQDVAAEVEGIEGDVIFRMVQTPSGRWRVYQVIVPGGDEDLRPWSVPSRN